MEEMERGGMVGRRQEGLLLQMCGTGSERLADLNGYSNSTSMLGSLSVRFLHSTDIRNMPE